MKDVRNNYNTVVGAYRKTMTCIVCKFRFLPKKMNAHVRDFHKMNIRTTCTWCELNLLQLSRDDGFTHRLLCLRQRYKAENRIKGNELVTAVEPVEEPRVPNMVTVISCDRLIYDGAIEREEDEWCVADEEVSSDLFNCSEVQQWYNTRGSFCRTLCGNVRFEDETLYKDLYPAGYPDWLTSIEGVKNCHEKYFLNQFPMDEIAGFDPFLQRAYSYKKNIKWHHISVRVSAWSSFMDFFREYRDKMYFSVHWCLCKGGKEHHRHMICVWERDNDREISRAFFKIRGNELETYRCKFKRSLDPVQHPTHLANLITYVSNPASQCRWEMERMEPVNDSLQIDEYLGFKTFKLSKRKQGQCHYWINQPVIPSLTLFSSFYTRNGVDAYLLHKYKNSHAWNEPSLRKTNRGWSCEARGISKEKYLIFPLPRNCEFVRVDESEEVRDFLEVGRKIFTFKENSKLLALSQYEWNRHQLLTENAALMNVGHMMFKLGKKQQEILNVLHDHTKVLHDEKVAQAKEIKGLNERLLNASVEVEIYKGQAREKEILFEQMKSGKLAAEYTIRSLQERLNKLEHKLEMHEGIEQQLQQQAVTITLRCQKEKEALQRQLDEYKESAQRQIDEHKQNAQRQQQQTINISLMWENEKKDYHRCLEEKESLVSQLEYLKKILDAKLIKNEE